MIDHGIEQNFIKPAVHELYFVASTVEQTITYLKTYQPSLKSDKWFANHPPSATE